MPYPDAKYPYDQRLARAAPDLLAACMNLFNCLMDWTEIADEEDRRSADDAAMVEASRAIAKAEGRTDDQ